MGNNDTINLLKECNSGTKMAVDSIDEILDKVKATELRDVLNSSRIQHEKLGNELHSLLLEHNMKYEQLKALNPNIDFGQYIPPTTKLTVYEK